MTASINLMMAWLIVFITQSGVLCFFLSLPPLLCSYCFCIALEIITPNNAATTYNYFLQHDCVLKPALLDVTTQFMSVQPLCFVVTRNSFCAVKACQTMG